jgi:single-strand DNA-binding protein
VAARVSNEKDIMASLNKVQIIGNLGADPETRYLPSGDAVTSIRVATTEKWKDKQTGEMQEATEWHSISFFGKLAEIASQYLKKGSQVYVEGKLQTRKYTDKNGVEKFATGIKADTMQMLGGRQASEGGEQRQAAPQRQQRPAAAPASAPQGFDDMDDDIPF